MKSVCWEMRSANTHPLFCCKGGWDHGINTQGFLFWRFWRLWSLSTVWNSCLALAGLRNWWTGTTSEMGCVCSCSMCTTTDENNMNLENVSVWKRSENYFVCSKLCKYYRKFYKKNQNWRWKSSPEFLLSLSILNDQSKINILEQTRHPTHVVKKYQERISESDTNWK